VAVFTTKVTTEHRSSYAVVTLLVEQNHFLLTCNFWQQVMKKPKNKAQLVPVLQNNTHLLL